MRKFGYFAIFICFFNVIAFAADSDPIDMLKSASTQMLDTLQKQKAQIKRNPEILQDIVNRILVPHVDVTSMSRSVVGRTYWQQATPAQRNEFMNEFTQFVIKSYAVALSSYRDEKVKFYPIRGGVVGKTRIEVQSDILQKDGPSIPVSYRLVKQGSVWKVYDFSVEGISMVQSYRSQFAAVLSQGGLPNLIARLKSRR